MEGGTSGQGPIITLENVEKRFGHFVAIQDISLEIRRGEFVSLLGPSGCGKSTLLRMVAGFERASRGRILIDGADVGDVPPNLRPVNMVFQSYALFPHLTVWDNIAFGLKRRAGRPARRTPAEIRREIGKYLALVGLDGMEARYPRQLSGGQQQRTALARALVKQPKVLLLDEPLGALDLKLRRRMQTELKQLQRELGITFVFVTHDQDEALALSDSIAVMNRGRVVQYGTARQLYDAPETAFVADFLGESNILTGTVTATGRTLSVDVGGQCIAVEHAGAAVASGDVVRISLRPEALRLATPSDACALCGVVREKTFLGNAFIVQLALPNGVAVSLRGHSRAQFDALELGREVRAGWDPTAARLVLA